MSSSTAMLFFGLVLVLGTALGRPLIADDGKDSDASGVFMGQIAMPSHLGFLGSPKGTFACRDPRLTNFIKTGVSYYKGNMGQLVDYIIKQLNAARYSGYWYVHAQMIVGQPQGLKWDAKTNGDIFNPAGTPHGCFYQDQGVYVLVLGY